MTEVEKSMAVVAASTSRRTALEIACAIVSGAVLKR
jgi:hypothetical protein